MNKKERRVINAFIDCVKSGEFSYNYACLLIEDTRRYGYLSDEAKEEFYAECANEPPEEDVIAENEDMKEALDLLGVIDLSEVIDHG